MSAYVVKTKNALASILALSPKGKYRSTAIERKLGGIRMESRLASANIYEELNSLKTF
jgi:hypothetical protein